MRSCAVIGILATQLLVPKVLGFVVHDPVHMAETLKNAVENTKRHTDTMLDNAKRHLEFIDKWKHNYELIREQIDEARRLQELIGNPKETVTRIAIDLWEGNSLDYFWKQKHFYWKLKEDANGTRSLAYGDLNKLYKAIETKDLSRNSIERDLDYYKRHDVVEQQAEQLEEVSKGAQTRKDALRAQRKEALLALKDAKTQSDIQAVTAELLAINGECDAIEAFEADEFRKLQLQRILNEERKEKERQDALERYIHEECLANNCIAQKLKTLKFRIEI